MNVQPFYSWDSTSPSGHRTSAQESLDETETLEQPSFPSSGDIEAGGHPTEGASESPPAEGEHYSLRPHRCPRITEGWTATRWSNRHHTDRLNVD